MLAHLLGTCPDALRADFQRVYRLDLDGLWGGSLRVTRAADLAAWLPMGSMCWIALDVPAAWTISDNILAGLFDAFDSYCWGISDPAKRGRKPDPLPRPGDKAKPSMGGTVASMTAEQLDEYLSRPRVAAPGSQGVLQH